MKTNLIRSAVLPLLLITATIFGCSKKESGTSGSAGGGIYDSAIYSLLPASTKGFVGWSSQSSGFAKFKRSAWAKSTEKSLADGLTRVSAQAGSLELGAIITAFTETGLLAFSPERPDEIKEGVIFVSEPPAGLGQNPPTPLSWGAILLLANGEPQKKLVDIERVLKSKGVSTARRVVGEKQGFGLEVSLSGGIHPFLVSTDEYLIVSDSELSAREILPQQPQRGIDRIKALPAFTSLHSKIDSTGEFLFGYLDTPSIFATLEKHGSELPPGADTPKLSELPIDGAMLSRSMGENLTDTALVLLNAKNDRQGKIIKGIPADGAAGRALKNLPADSVVAAALDGPMLASFAKERLSEPGTEQETAAQLELMNGLKSIALGVRNASAASPFPDLLLAIDTNNGADLVTLVKSQVGGFFGASSGMQAPPWSSKEIEGSKVEYFLTPFGIGLFLSTTSDQLLIGSSEGAIRATILTRAKKEKSLVEALPPDAEKLLNNETPIVAGHINFAEMASLIETVQGSMAMFTGGKSLVDPSQTAELTRLGSATGSVSFNQSTLSLHQVYGEPAPAQQ